MRDIPFYQEQFLKYLNEYRIPSKPENLYQPMQYILQLGGKRLRPVLTLMSCDLFGGSYALALPAALSIEVFHNFSLVHDDIMDDAPLRRGELTVHEKWDINTGILSGDAMLIKAYQLFENYDPQTFLKLAKLFSKTAVEVCEGQQYDIDFETREDVTIQEYLKMITYKTAVLVGAAMKMGAIVAQANVEQQDLIYEYGKNLGIAFQLQDDYLDAFGDSKSFGKQIGGDIVENKKTFLFLKAEENLNGEGKRQLHHIFSIQPKDKTDKINAVKEIFESSGAAAAIKFEIEKYTHAAFQVLEKLGLDDERTKVFKQFGEQLMKRKV